MEEDILKKKDKKKDYVKVTSKTKSKKKVVIIVLLLIILIAVAVFVYFKYFRKDNTNYFGLYDVTFKTDDGRKLSFYTESDEVVGKEARNIYKNKYLEVCQNNDKNYNLEYCKDFENDSFDVFNYHYNIFQIKEDYIKKYSEYSKLVDINNPQNYQSYLHSWAKFDDKVIGIFKFNYNINYGLYAGNDISKEPQYPYEYYFLLDYNTGRIIQYDEEIDIITHTVYDDVYHQGTTLGTTYFAKKDKASSRYKVYTTDFKYLGDSLSSPYNLTDDDGYVYVINDGIISKYDEKGNKKESLRDVKNIVDFAIFHNNCLALIYENKNLYLYDFSDNSKVQLKINLDYYTMNTRKNITDNFFFHYNDEDMLNNEVIIYGVSNGNNTIYTSLGSFAVYDYANKKFKMTNRSTVYSNDNVTVELEEYDSKTNDDGTEIKYYYLYSGDKKIKVTSYPYYDKNSDVLVVSNDNNVYILNTKTKKIITYYTSKKKLVVEKEGSYEHEDWYEIFENSVFKDKNGKLVVVAHKDTGDIIRLSNEMAKGVLGIDDKLYIAFSKKLIKYSNTGKVLETIIYDEIYVDEYSLVGDLLGDVIIKKSNDYYLINIYESALKLVKLEKSILYSSENGTLYVYKTGDRSFVLHDNVRSELATKPEKEDNNYAIYSYPGSMCGGNVFVDKKLSKITRTADNMNFIKTASGYFFYDSECSTSGGQVNVYTTSWKYIGASFMSSGEIDANGNIYVVNDGYIELKDVNGKLVEKSKAYNGIGSGLAKDNIVYVVVGENKKAYLISMNSKLEEISKIEVNATLHDLYLPYIELKNDKIEISITNVDEENETFTYDISTKKIEKVERSD